MPIFEDFEEISPEEMKRQQAALNEKMQRAKTRELFNESMGHDGGDCWDSEDDM